MSIDITGDKSYALTGGIATGKSTVARMFSKRGAYIVDTDILAREVVEPGQPALDDIIKAFGRDILSENGKLDRDAMRSIIIRDPDKRKLLNSITHPRIQELALHRILEFRNRDSRMPVLIDVPLLYEAGWHVLFPSVILVYVSRDVQIQRLIDRDGICREEAELTLKTQMSIEEKRERADIIIDNSDSISSTELQVDELFHRLIHVI